MTLKRLLPWLAGIWLFLQGIAQIWPTLTRQTIPEWLSTLRLPGVPAVNFGGNVLGWSSLTIGAAILITLILQIRARAFSATGDPRSEQNTIAELQNEIRRNRSAVAERDALRQLLRRRNKSAKEYEDYSAIPSKPFEQASVSSLKRG